MLVAALGFVLRALVPVGFMPDAKALQAGFIELTVCSPQTAGNTTRSISIAWSAETGDGALHPSSNASDVLPGVLPEAPTGSPTHTPGSLASPADCPFSLMAAQGMIAAPEVLIAAVTSRYSPLAFLAPAASPARVADGPPLGPRAPPSAA